MPYHDDTNQLRHRIEADRGTLDQVDSDQSGDRRPRLVKIAPATYGYGPGTSASPGVFPAWPCVLDADELAGGAVTITADTSVVVYVVNIGTGVPVGGEILVALPLDGRLVVAHG